MLGRLSKTQESLFKQVDETAEQMGEPMKEDAHVNRLQEDRQDLSADCIGCSDGVKPNKGGVFGEDRGLIRAIWPSSTFQKPSQHLPRYQNRTIIAA
jgi:hypothetical protein